MGRKSKYTLEQKVKAVEDYKNGKRGTMQICKDLNMRKINLYKWIVIYDDYGEIGFLPKKEINHIQQISKQRLLMNI